MATHKDDEALTVSQLQQRYNERKKKLSSSAGKGPQLPSFLKSVRKEEVEEARERIRSYLEEGKKRGLWDNIHAKRKRGERPAKPGEEGYPKTLNVEEVEIEEGIEQARKNVGASKCWADKKLGNPPTKMKGGKEVPNCVPKEEFELLEKAPPGAKYERMVKHIKQSLKGDPRALEIAYATAWKQYNKKTQKEEYIAEKARGTRPKRTVHAYDVDETLFSHGKKGKPNVKVHVKDASGKRVKSLSNQEFNTHKLEKGHKYDFSEFQSAKKFKETSSSNKKVIKDIKRKQARGQNVHLVTARSKFDKPSEFQGHLKKHGVNVDKKNIHYTGGMKGSDIGDKKVAVVNAIAKKAGAKKAHMYDDAAKVHKSFEAEKKKKPTSMKYKTHMVAPDKSGESRVRSYQATK